VFHSLPGHPAFPVRLASEIFQRCAFHRARIDDKATHCTLYDPCCGAGYMLSVLAFLHRGAIEKIIASDIDEKAVAVTRRNLELASLSGLEQRTGEISTMVELYGKESHREALRSAQFLKREYGASFQEQLHQTRIFRASALDGKEMLKQIPPRSVDIVITDIPYGEHSSWEESGSSEPVWAMLEALTGVLSASGIVAITSSKQQKATHAGYQRVEQFQVGKRRVAILRLINQ
jgi:tRNA G10  N-methylase Trm11